MGQQRLEQQVHAQACSSLFRGMQILHSNFSVYATELGTHAHISAFPVKGAGSCIFWETARHAQCWPISSSPQMAYDGQRTHLLLACCFLLLRSHTILCYMALSWWLQKDTKRIIKKKQVKYKRVNTIVTIRGVRL